MYDDNLKPHQDPEIREFEEALLRSMEQANQGEFAQVHTAPEISARIAKKRGRPVGSVKESPKVTTTIRLDEDLLELLRESGSGWQTRVNDELRAAFRLAGKLT